MPENAQPITRLTAANSMTIAEKIEQTFTNRPNSYVPGHTLRVILGMTPRPDSQMFNLNMAMHWGQGMCAAGLRGLMSYYGVRGPFADFIFTCMRLCVDQTLENATGVGALPWQGPKGFLLVFMLLADNSAGLGRSTSR